MGPYGMSLVFDGHKVKNIGVTCYFGRGFDKNHALKEIMIDIKNNQKQISNQRELVNLLHIETGQDIFEAVDNLLTEIGAKWGDINGLTGDGKSAHTGKLNGIYICLYLFIFALLCLLCLLCLYTYILYIFLLYVYIYIHCV